VNVYLIPLGPDRFEPYFEHEDADETAGAGRAPGFFARMSTRFSEMIREAERQRHERPHATTPPRPWPGCSTG
jgi:hypothetical protein